MPEGFVPTLKYLINTKDGEIEENDRVIFIKSQVNKFYL